MTAQNERPDISDLEFLEECARKAHLDATQGPVHLRSGRMILDKPWNNGSELCQQSAEQPARPETDNKTE